MNKLLLIDGNSILNRAFYGLPDLTTSDGRHTNAVLGFLNIFLKVVDEVDATHVCVAFDVKHPTFRHEMYEEYKGTRKPMAEELREQLPLIREVLKAMNIYYIERPGYEADDILGTLSVKYNKDDCEVIVLSGDRDLLQLATDRVLVKIPKTKAGKTIIENYYADDVKALYGVDPVTFIDMKGLMGDTSDNIPGVPGVGEKTASKLLIDYGSLDGIYDNIESLKKGKLKDNLVTYKEQAYMSKFLATIKLDCELDTSIDDMTIDKMYNEKSYSLFKELEFKSLINRFSNMDNQVSSTADISSEAIFVDDFDQYKELFDTLAKCEKIGFSLIESMGNIIALSLAYNDEKTYIVKIMNFITMDMISEDIKKLLSAGVLLCCLDVKSQLPFLGITAENNLFDCGVAAYLINPTKDQYGYDDIARDYLNAGIESKKELVGKREINLFTIEDQEIIKHMSYMSMIPYMAYSNINSKLKDMDMHDLYYDIELPCVFALYDMERNGIKVDKESLILFGDTLKGRIDELTKAIYSQAGKQFNINSTKQLGEILFEDLGLPHGKKTKTGYSTSVEVLEKISGEHPIVPLLLEYRQLTKLNSTYVEGLIPYICEDGRIHGKFNQTVTATGRISSTEPNLQNIPTRFPLGREVRKVFVPETGCVFLDADYSQIELRVLAHLSKDETLIDAYNKDSDIHSITASEVFDVSLDEVTDLMRRKAKAVNFGIIYGISSFGLGQDLDISRKEAEGYIEKYFRTYGKVKEFMDKCVSDAKETGYSLTLFNRRRPIPELKSSNYMVRSFGERVAMNAPIQGTAADIIKIAMIRVNNELKEKKLKSRLVLQVHDELIIETKLEELEEVKTILVNQMMNAAKLLVSLVVDVNEGYSWYDAK